uniref:Uncharacterized protein n=1 Tax=Trichuris muris TaxID=70415 RepID=A0A5S6Q887_TRIMR
MSSCHSIRMALLELNLLTKMSPAIASSCPPSVLIALLAGLKRKSESVASIPERCTRFTTFTVHTSLALRRPRLSHAEEPNGRALPSARKESSTTGKPGATWRALLWLPFRWGTRSKQRPSRLRIARPKCLLTVQRGRDRKLLAHLNAVG